MSCNHCHTCGARLQRHYSGADWCSVCVVFRCYRSHGCPVAPDPSPCPEFPEYVQNWLTAYPGERANVATFEREAASWDLVAEDPDHELAKFGADRARLFRVAIAALKAVAT